MCVVVEALKVVGRLASHMIRKEGFIYINNKVAPYSDLYKGVLQK